MSGVGRPPLAATLGKTRVCPHCKATVLESASVCPGCRHHLRFDPGATQREEPSFTAWKVDGVIGPKGSLESCEYSVVIALRNEEGRELARHVVAVGALQPHERRAFSLSVEITPPRSVAAPRTEAAAVAPKPVASGINRPPPPLPPPPSATVREPTGPGGRPGVPSPAAGAGGPAGAPRPGAPGRPGSYPDPRPLPALAPRPAAPDPRTLAAAGRPGAPRLPSAAAKPPAGSRPEAPHRPPGKLPGKPPAEPSADD